MQRRAASIGVTTPRMEAIHAGLNIYFVPRFNDKITKVYI
jgi:hypothetical protein